MLKFAEAAAVDVTLCLSVFWRFESKFVPAFVTVLVTIGSVLSTNLAETFIKISTK